MPTTHYEGSRGPVEIATMSFPYASNALAKLQRDRVDTSRDDEIAAIAAHIAKLQEEYAEQQTLAAASAPADDLGASDIDMAPTPADNFASEVAF